MFVAVTPAPTNTAPVESFTVPEILAVTPAKTRPQARQTTAIVDSAIRDRAKRRDIEVPVVANARILCRLIGLASQTKTSGRACGQWGFGKCFIENVLLRIHRCPSCLVNWRSVHGHEFPFWADTTTPKILY